MKLSQSALKTIASCRFFNNLPSKEFQAVVNAGRPYRLTQGEYFFHQGEPATRFYILGEGEVKLTQLTPDGHQIIVNYIAPSDGFGIVVALSQMEYPVAAEAVVDCAALQFDREIIKQLMFKYPQLAINGMELIARQFALLQTRLQQMATQRVEQRVARTLLQLTRQFGKKNDEGILIDLPLSRQDLAEMTGTNLYQTSRILSKWEQAGIVKTARKQVTLCNPHQLVTIAEDLPPSKK